MPRPYFDYVVVHVVSSLAHRGMEEKRTKEEEAAMAEEKRQQEERVQREKTI